MSEKRRRPMCARSFRELIVLALTAVSTSGCNGSSATLSVSGKLSLDGIQIPAEIQIEQLDADGNRVGRTVIAYADGRGRFSASIEPEDRLVDTLNCRFIVRVSELSSSGLPLSLDENSVPEKTIRLRRMISDNDSIAILLTR